MTKRVAQLESELKIVQWYLETLEDGIDTKEIITEYTSLKRDHKVYKRKSDAEISKLKTEVEKMTTKYEEAMSNLNR